MSNRNQLTRSHLLHGATLLCLVVLAMVLRWPGLSDGYTSDEASLSLPWSFLDIMRDGKVL